MDASGAASVSVSRPSVYIACDWTTNLSISRWATTSTPTAQFKKNPPQNSFRCSAQFYNICLYFHVCRERWADLSGKLPVSLIISISCLHDTFKLMLVKTFQYCCLRSTFKICIHIWAHWSTNCWSLKPSSVFALQVSTWCLCSRRCPDAALICCCLSHCSSAHICVSVALSHFW